MKSFSLHSTTNNYMWL